MPELLLLRHAKSPHPSGVADHDRPILPEAGRRVARLARELAVAGVVPDLVLCSDAVRALATARLYFGALWAAQGVFTLFAVLFFFVGAQFLAFGIMGEYVGRIYREVKRRPPYTIRRIY